MRKPIALCALAALSLAACQKSGGEAPAAAAADAVAPAPAAEAAAVADGPSTTPLTPLAPLGVSVPQLAYAYKYALAAPPKSVRKLVSKHEQVCWAAGPTVCQVVGSSVSEDGPDKVSATLSLRAQPTWLRTFRAGLEDDTKAVGGRTITADTASDDLSRNIVDTEAALRSRVILRDRLEAALRTRSGKVSELFEVEQQLAQVRGEIDAARSELAMMKTRVATSQLTISYRSEGVLAPSGTLAPLAEAFGEVAGILVLVLSVLVRVVAVLAIPVGAGAGIWWLMRRRKPIAKA